MTQINPPYDESEPCPACQLEVRSVSAYLHNFLTRCRDGKVEHGKAFLRLVDMRKGGFPESLSVPHPAAQEVVDVGIALAQAIAGIVDEGLTIKWTPEIRERVEALIPRAMAASDAFRLICDAHGDDARHSRGEENILREQRGSHWAGFINPDYEAASYNHTVDVVPSGHASDLKHLPCGTGLALHSHFRDVLSKDRSFYGKVWCKTCGINAPFKQFECTI